MPVLLVTVCTWHLLLLAVSRELPMYHKLLYRLWQCFMFYLLCCCYFAMLQKFLMRLCKLFKVRLDTVTAYRESRAVAGGVLGAMMAAMQNGVARGIFSNEAGLGSAPIAAAAAKTKDTSSSGSCFV